MGLVDLQKTMGDASLPQGCVSFIVGPERSRLEHVSKNILCVRSTYFDTMFRAGMCETWAMDIEVPDTSMEALAALLRYVISDSIDDDMTVDVAFDVACLAGKYDMIRLKTLCMQIVESRLTLSSVVPVLEYACQACDRRLLMHCRKYIAEHYYTVQQAGGVGQIKSLVAAKGLLTDAVKHNETAQDSYKLGGLYSVMNDLNRTMKVKLPQWVESYETQCDRRLLACCRKFLLKNDGSAVDDVGVQQLEDLYTAKGLLNDLFQHNESMRTKHDSNFKSLIQQLEKQLSEREQ